MEYPVKLETVELEGMARAARRLIIKMIYEAGSGHPGGSLSCIDILVYLYFNVMRHDPGSPGDVGRDRFILSKGHVCPALYAVLSLCGYFPEEDLFTLRRLGSPLQGHPNMLKLKGIDASTGSLGQGLSIGNGMAFALSGNGSPARVYCLLGDGELDEGQIWEAAATAGHYGLSNITAIVDRNGYQIDGSCGDVKNKEPVPERFGSLGWKVYTGNGHDMGSIRDVFSGSAGSPGPSVLIFDTIKGKGVSFMEGDPSWHGKPIGKKEYEKAMRELGNER